MKKKYKQRFAYGIMLVSTTIVIFNNVGQTMTLIEVPFTKTIQYWVAGISFFVGAIWTLYLKGILK